MRVFFYGLFMDENLLATRGIHPAEVVPGFVDDFALRIGERATLVREPGGRAHGVVMDIAAGEAAELYADSSVADYVAEPVVVELMGGARLDASCYNLPVEKVTGANKAYAEKLLRLAARLQFPPSYLDEIRRAGAAS